MNEQSRSRPARSRRKSLSRSTQRSSPVPKYGSPSGILHSGPGRTSPVDLTIAMKSPLTGLRTFGALTLPSSATRLWRVPGKVMVSLPAFCSKRQSPSGSAAWPHPWSNGGGSPSVSRMSRRTTTSRTRLGRRGLLRRRRDRRGDQDVAGDGNLPGDGLDLGGHDSDGDLVGDANRDLASHGLGDRAAAARSAPPRSAARAPSCRQAPRPSR